MKKEKKTDQDIVKKAESEPVKDRISDFKVHTTKPIIEFKDKRKKQKERIGDAKKEKRNKTASPSLKTAKIKPGTNDKGNKGREPGKGEKAGVQGVIEKRGERSGLDRILEKILPPWF